MSSEKDSEAFRLAPTLMHECGGLVLRNAGSDKVHGALARESL